MKKRTPADYSVAAYKNSFFNFKPTRDKSNPSDRSTKSRDKRMYDQGDRFNVSYPAYQKYLAECSARNVDPLDYRSYKNLLKKIHTEIINYTLGNMKSYKFRKLGILNVLYKERVGNPDIVQNKVRVLSLKFNRSLSRYIKRYSLINSDYIKRLISYLDITRSQDLTKRDFIMINSRL